MKKSVTIILVSVFALALLVGAFLLLGHDKLPYNNTTDKHDLVNRTYSISEIESLKTEFETRQNTNEEYRFSEFKRDFEVECVRKSLGGYYVILFLDNGSEAFVFFNEEMEMFSVMIFDRFLSVEDFENLPSFTDIYKFDPNAERLDTGSHIYIHIVQEGVLRARYITNWDRAGEFAIEGLEEFEQYVDEHPEEFYTQMISKQFWTNSELIGDENFIGKGSAYILEIDKYI